MADVVEYRIECTLPEYEQMRILNLFTPDEILKMKKSRESFEYRIAQPSRSLKDFVEFIKYERSILVLTKQKLNKNHTIAALISNRMKHLYIQTLSLFPNNLLFWDEFIRFLHQSKFTKDISSTFDRMLQFHSDKPSAWIRAILWEYNENYTEDRVKGLLLRAQQLHPESQKLYLIFFQITLENKGESSEETAIKCANIVYLNGKKVFKNASSYIEMLNIVDKFSYAKSIQLQMLMDIQEMFPNDELVWHNLAQRQLNGLPSIEQVKLENVNSDLNESKGFSVSEQLSIKKRIEHCIETYKEAVEKVNTTKIWNYYINAMIELNVDLTTQASLKRFALSQAIKGAFESNHMLESHYLQYIEMLFSNNPKDENIVEVFQKAVKEFGTSPSIWFQYIRYYIHTDDQKNVKILRNIFESAKKRLGSESADIWYLYVTYLKSHASAETNAEFDRLILELACQPHSNYNKVKANILEFLEKTTNMKRTREAYNLFTKNFPGCYEVHEMMADIEAKQAKRDPTSERKCLELLTMNFGKIFSLATALVWIRYMRFERDAGDPKNVGRLYQNALATLKPELLDEFTAQYNSFSNGTD